ncbi:MAG: ABC-F family ATP-binding cassette domain-containing protein [Spirochaetota bacterium]
MTNLVSVDKISAMAGNKLLFESASFGINAGEKVALIGTNGCGKSTLIRLIRGVEEPSSGNIYRNNQLKIASLAQAPLLDSEASIRDFIFRSESPVVLAIHTYQKACASVETSPGEESQQALESAYKVMEELNAWEYEQEIASLLQELGIFDINLKMGALSGGMLKKVNLAHTLLEDSNFLILDEPTNHLDIETILWLQNYLQKSDKAVLLVTHDRYFLNEITDKIYEIDKKQILRFDGNYDYYLSKKVEIENSLARAEEKAQSFLRKELQWLKRQPKARGTKQKAREDRIYAVAERKKPEKQQDIELSVTGRRLGKKILEVKNLCKSFADKPILDTFNYTFKKNEKLGVVGRNGSGKSTLLNLLAKRLEPDSGVVDHGLNTKISYFDQHSSLLEDDKKVIDFIKKNAGEYITLENGDKISAGKMLERFLFDAGAQYGPIDKLSGGEKRRLYLVYLLMKDPNFLILDEPTNDLDIKTLSILEDFLDQFTGCLVIVSHDRYFMNRLVDSILVVSPGGKIEGFPGNYDLYLQHRKKSEKKQNDASGKEKRQKDRNPKKRSYKQEKELAQLEKDIAALEESVQKLQEELAQNSADYQKLQELTQTLQTAEENLLQKMERWEELYAL